MDVLVNMLVSLESRVTWKHFQHVHNHFCLEPDNETRRACNAEPRSDCLEKHKHAAHAGTLIGEMVFNPA